MTPLGDSWINVVMRRALMLTAMIITLGACATPAPPPVWYLVSPTPNENYPHGNLNSPMTGWEKVRNYPTADDCENAIMDMHNQLHRPVDCVASNDPRLEQP